MGGERQVWGWWRRGGGVGGMYGRVIAGGVQVTINKSVMFPYIRGVTPKGSLVQRRQSEQNDGEMKIKENQ